MTKSGENYATPDGLRLAQFLRTVDFREFFAYDGSLTTPPCTEGIKWNVIKDVQPISQRQLDAFTNLWEENKAYACGNGNNRRVQPLNDRDVYTNSRVTFMSGNNKLVEEDLDGVKAGKIQA